MFFEPKDWPRTRVLAFEAGRYKPPERVHVLQVSEAAVRAVSYTLSRSLMPVSDPVCRLLL